MRDARGHWLWPDWLVYFIFMCLWGALAWHLYELRDARPGWLYVTFVLNMAAMMTLPYVPREPWR